MSNNTPKTIRIESDTLYNAPSTRDCYGMDASQWRDYAVANEVRHSTQLANYGNTVAHIAQSGGRSPEGVPRNVPRDRRALKRDVCPSRAYQRAIAQGRSHETGIAYAARALHTAKAAERSAVEYARPKDVIDGARYVVAFDPSFIPQEEREADRKHRDQHFLEGLYHQYGVEVSTVKSHWTKRQVAALVALVYVSRAVEEQEGYDPACDLDTIRSLAHHKGTNEAHMATEDVINAMCDPVENGASVWYDTRILLTLVDKAPARLPALDATAHLCPVQASKAKVTRVTRVTVKDAFAGLDLWTPQGASADLLAYQQEAPVVCEDWTVPAIPKGRCKVSTHANTPWRLHKLDPWGDALTKVKRPKADKTLSKAADQIQAFAGLDQEDKSALVKGAIKAFGVGQLKRHLEKEGAWDLWQGGNTSDRAEILVILDLASAASEALAV